MVFSRSLILLGLCAVPAVSMAQLSANLGMVSDYVYRGYFQADGSAFAGLDYEHESGFYIGTWGAEVGKGIETDLYFGYGGSAGDFGWGVGFTGYYYTDDFDDTYEEVNLGISYGGLALDVAIGEWDGFGAPEDYSFVSIGYEFEGGAYIAFGSFGQDFDGDYAEIGYGLNFMGLDLSMALIASSDLPVSQDDSADFNLVFGVSKGISFGE